MALRRRGGAGKARTRASEQGCEDELLNPFCSGDSMGGRDS